MRPLDVNLVHRCVDLLNEMIDLDPEATTRLIKALLNHPTIQASEELGVGLLVVLNGLCGTGADGRGCVAVIGDEDGKVVEAKAIRDAAEPDPVVPLLTIKGGDAMP